MAVALRVFEGQRPEVDGKSILVVPQTDVVGSEDVDGQVFLPLIFIRLFEKLKIFDDGFGRGTSICHFHFPGVEDLEAALAAKINQPFGILENVLGVVGRGLHVEGCHKMEQK